MSPAPILAGPDTEGMRARGLRPPHSEAAANETGGSTPPDERTNAPARTSASGEHDVQEAATADDPAIPETIAADRREWLGKLSHELRTPLNAIIGFTKLLHAGKAGPLSLTQSEYVSDVLASSHHLLKLINDALDFAKLEVAGIPFEFAAVDPTLSVREVCDAVADLMLAKQQRLVLDLDATLGALWLDAHSFERVLLHYLSNAIRFTPHEGRIRITLGPDGAGHFRVEIEDSGPGIKPDDLDRLFVAFETLDTRKRHAGSGLGLALVKRLVEVQGGSVAVASTLGRGSVFSARFPRRPAAADAIGPAARSRKRK
jgi:signal transduction histidine kinase